MKEINNRISVIGAGSWGTALCNLLAKKGIETIQFVRNEKLLETLEQTRENNIYLPNIKLSENIHFTNDLKEAVHSSNVILLSIPVAFLRHVLKMMKPYVNNNHIFINSGKGMENETLKTPRDIVNDVLKVDKLRFASISGPNFAKEIADELPAATVIASENTKLAKDITQLFSTRYLRIYTSEDVVGVEIAGALKNVIAIASGISDGLGFGNNARASLITRGLAEIRRIGMKLGAHSETFMGLAGIGDLVLTCTGNLSRNRQVGIRLSEKESIDNILNDMVMVPEGVKTAKSVFNLSRKIGVDAPLSDEVYKIIYEKKDSYQAFTDLMKRPLKNEI